MYGNKVHPKTGMPIEGYVSKSGTIWYTPLGASDDDESDTDTGQSAGNGSTTDSGQSASASGSTSTTTDADTNSESDGADKVDRADFERLRNQLSAADRKREEAEKRAKEYEDRDKGELEKATERADQLKSENEGLRTQLATLRMERAVLTDAEFGASRWHDPEDTVSRLSRAVENGDITVNDKGEVSGVGKFLKKLAADKAYLLKPEEKPITPATGRTAAGRTNSTNGGDDEREKRRAKLRADYPALNRN